MDRMLAARPSEFQTDDHDRVGTEAPARSLPPIDAHEQEVSAATLTGSYDSRSGHHPQAGDKQA